MITRRSKHFIKILSCVRYSSVDIVKHKQADIIAKEEKLPIERTSLSRGLALNKFEKDFLIYPEFTDTDDVENIKAFTSKVQNELETALTEGNNEDQLSDNVLALLLKNGVFSVFVPEEYGGIGLNHKNLLCLTEALGIDLSTFLFVNQTYIASRLIQLYGSEEQKEKYLPKLASFQIKPAFCINDLPSGESVEILAYSGIDKKLNGWKNDVINGDIADIYFVFGQEVSQNGENVLTCCIIDKEKNDDKIMVAEKKVTQGLKAISLTKLNFSNVTVTEKNILGGPGDGREAVNEILSCGNFYLGSAVVGFLKKLLKELVNNANVSIQGNHRLSENVVVRRTLSDSAMNTFILESVMYYLGGLMDEGLVLSTDIENAIVQRLINRILRESYVTVTQIVGSSTTTKDQVYDKLTRDMNTLLSLNVNDLSLVKTISLSMIVSWVEASSHESKFLKANTLKRFFENQVKSNAWLNPKLKHFMAEHVHPSLEPACRQLENTMSRLDIVLNRIVEDSGSRVKEEFETLWSLAKILENNLTMIATIARASRSYSIGLRNCDLELAWTLAHCYSAARQSQQELELLMDYYGLIKKNPSLINIGTAVIDFGGYPLERPIERNW